MHMNESKPEESKEFERDLMDRVRQIINLPAGKTLRSDRERLAGLGNSMPGTTDSRRIELILKLLEGKAGSFVDRVRDIVVGRSLQDMNEADMLGLVNGIRDILNAMRKERDQETIRKLMEGEKPH